MNIENEIKSGLRCKTFVIKKNGVKIIYQEYKDNSYYQAKKKYKILNKISSNNETEYIPKCYKYCNLEDKSVLYTEYKTGKSLREIRENNPKFNFSKITKKLAETLCKIHSIKDSDYFGWITDNGCIGNSNLIDCVINEFDRFNSVFKEKLSNKDFSYIEKKERCVIDCIKKKNNIKPQLIWYDLNPENILVNEDDELSCIVDPGGAKYCVKELDLAFLKMEVCKNEEEFQSLLIEYKKIDNTVDEELINAMTILVELDDIMLRIQENLHIPIPYCSDFKELINRL